MNAVTKPPVDIIDAWHITIATNDLDRQVHRFWNDFGIGPWHVIRISCPERAVMVDGKPAAVDLEAALAQVGFLGIGYDMPLTRPSPFDEMIAARGSGGHHLAFMVRNYEEACAHMKRCGYRELLRGDEIGPNRDGKGVYWSTIEDMGTIIEFSAMPSKMPEPHRVLPANADAKPRSGLQVKGTAHVAIAVRDVERCARRYREVLGIESSRIFTFSAKAKYLGRDADYSLKAAVLTIGTYTVVLEQPVSSPAPLQDFLDRNGQGIHHICFIVDDFEGSVTEMRRLGYEAVFSSRGFGPNSDGMSAYFDTEKSIGVVIELARPPSGDLTA